MIPLTRAELEGLGLDRLELAPGAGAVTGVVIDSRIVRPGDLFVAIGRGSDYLAEARGRGAAATLVPTDPFAAMAVLGRAVRVRSSARVVAITGSTGKTSTKDILGALCRPHARTVVAEGSQNNEIGLPLTLCRIEPTSELVIVEMGMRGLGQIAELCELARPQVGVVTGVGAAHLEALGTLERIAQAKAELIAALPSGGTAVVPAGEPLLEPLLARRDIRVLRVGEGGEVRLRAFRRSEPLSELELELDGSTLRLNVSSSLSYQAANAAMAVAAYVALGLPLERVQAGALEVQLSRWRGEELSLPGGGVLVNDCYNANPVSLRAALEDFAERAGGRRTLAVLGTMAELGAEAPRYHREIGELARRLGIDSLLAVGEPARAYLEGYRGGLFVPDAAAAAQEASDLLRGGEWVLVKGSRAVGLELVAEALMSSFPATS